MARAVARGGRGGEGAARGRGVGANGDDSGGCHAGHASPPVRGGLLRHHPLRRSVGDRARVRARRQPQKGPADAGAKGRPPAGRLPSAAPVPADRAVGRAGHGVPPLPEHRALRPEGRQPPLRPAGPGQPGSQGRRPGTLPAEGRHLRVWQDARHHPLDGPGAVRAHGAGPDGRGGGVWERERLAKGRARGRGRDGEG